LSILTMILAGGTGKELSVLTRHRAKTALPFGGRYRIIDFALSNCVHSGITDISILAQYSPKSLIYHIGMGKPWDLDRRVGGVFILQPTHYGEIAQWYLGTADALYQNIDVIRNSSAEHVLVLSGDQVYVMDYRRIVAHHMETRSDVTIAIKEVSPSQRSRFGMIGRTTEGVVTHFEEKPESSLLRYASLGIYLFNKKLLLDLLHPDKLDIVFDLIIPLFERKKITCYQFDGYWEDIGSLRSYYRASLRMLRDRSLLSTPDWPVYTRGSNLPPAKIAGGSRVIDSILADGCIVEGDVAGSILFPGVRVEKGARIENSIVFSFTKIGRDARVQRAILDKHVSIGAGSRVGIDSIDSVRGDARLVTSGVSRLKAQLAVLGKGAKLKRGSVVATGVTIEPRYLPGKWGEE
jgi:glucose-1-phosphate adenylyltransferase